MFRTCLLRRANGNLTIFFCDWHVTYRRIQEPFLLLLFFYYYYNYYYFLSQRWLTNFWSPLIDNPFNDGF